MVSRDSKTLTASHMDIKKKSKINLLKCSPKHKAQKIIFKTPVGISASQVIDFWVSDIIYYDNNTVFCLALITIAWEPSKNIIIWKSVD